MSSFCFGICGTMGPLVNHIVLLWSHFENQPPKQELPMAERGDSELIERFLFPCTHTMLYRLCTLSLCTHKRQFAHPTLRTLCTTLHILHRTVSRTKGPSRQIFDLHTAPQYCAHHQFPFCMITVCRARCSALAKTCSVNIDNWKLAQTSHCPRRAIAIFSRLFRHL